MWHPTLNRQLKKLGLQADIPPAAEVWTRFLERVNGAYLDADQDRYTMERSLGISSEEMRDLTIRLQTALEQLRQLSLTDDLTGLWNRRFLHATIPEVVAQVTRAYHVNHSGREETSAAKANLLFIMVDLDHFKRVNDTHGHAAGDQVLAQLSRLLMDCARDMDTVIRWGGEEFLVVARNVFRDDYHLLPERIRKAVASHSFDIGRESPLRLTCSLGAAVFPFLPRWPEGLSWDKVVTLADACLYAAKHSGRNAWVGVLPTDLASIEDLTPQMAEHLPALLQQGKLAARTSLPETARIIWTG